MSFADMFIKSGMAKRVTQSSNRVLETGVDAMGDALRNLSKGSQKGLFDDVAKSLERSPSRDISVVHTTNPGQRASGGAFSFNNASAAAERREAISRVTDDVLDNADDLLPKVDDYWTNRQGEMVDEYVDDVYKRIDDSLNSPSYSPFDDNPFGF